MNFTHYLKARKYSPSTIRRYTGYASVFESWLSTENIAVQDFSYTDLLSFIQDLQHKETGRPTQSLMLCAIRHYADHLQSSELRRDNPATGLYLKGRTRKLPHGLLSQEELEELYHQYSVQLHVDPVKKILLGLLLFQGLRVGELLTLKGQHIRQQEGKITIIASRSSNARTLSLHGCQMALLGDHLRRIGNRDTLFSFHRSHNLHSQVQYMFEQLKRLNPKATSAKQVRSSVIADWLSKHPLREVQYMAGHKYVSSTEWYQLNQLDALQEAVRQHHPMRWQVIRQRVLKHLLQQGHDISVVQAFADHKTPSSTEKYREDTVKTLLAAVEEYHPIR